MQEIYLISKQDKYCPENNNGDYIIECWDNYLDAKTRCEQLDYEYPTDIHIMIGMTLNMKVDDRVDFV